MDVRYSEELSQAFVVGPTDLKKLIELLEKRVGVVDVSAGCVDEIERKFNTVEDINTYENSKSKRIRRIHLSAQSDDYSKSATIVFRDATWYSLGISINVNGREDVVSRLREEVLDIAIGMRPWYNWIACANLVKIFAVGFYALLFIALISISLEWLPGSNSPPSDSEIGKGKAIASLFILGVLLCLWAIHWLRGFLFPKGFFTIGQGVSRFNLLEKIRWGVIVSFFVSLAAGFVIAILQLFAL